MTQDEMRRKLRPAKNYRWVNRRVCSNCKYWIGDDFLDGYECLRSPDEIAGDWNANEPEFHVCDGWKVEGQPS